MANVRADTMERIPQMKITLKNAWFIYLLAAIIGAGLGW